ncbi:hypothetical protein BDA96_06G150300 [Sorghum bicolor]|uniref:Uncharacterized protein n=2 Tax=Sorghum bicolor TaxID=4558 RepID=A0A921QRJ8_SORBI|nr:hypothetical protein BDA96_06G150300 [Sorghum bicolor]OQU81879.1 hypothetical protein SORBI_3006G135701 [Sorghum bicolor]
MRTDLRDETTTIGKEMDQATTVHGTTMSWDREQRGHMRRRRQPGNAQRAMDGQTKEADGTDSFGRNLLSLRIWSGSKDMDAIGLRLLLSHRI